MSFAPHHVTTGPVGGPVVVFIGSLGTSLHMWDAQLNALSDRYRCIAVDLPGHGRSTLPPESVTVESYAADVLALLERLSVGRASVVGLSFGGAVAQVLAASASSLVDRLVLASTAAGFSDRAEFWLGRAATVRERGMGEAVRASSNVWFASGYAGRQPLERDRLITQLATTPRDAYAACCDALAVWDGSASLGQIVAPTLVLSGEFDEATPRPMALGLVAGIPDASLQVVADAAHLVNVEQPADFTQRVRNHLETPVA